MDIGGHVLWHKNKWISPAIAAFRGLVTEKAEDALPPRLPEGSFGD
jgi:hypothetical protein